ncbi:unnamed protein product, partial [Ectocarpus sp. 12 AP-2014]
LHTFCPYGRDRSHRKASPWCACVCDRGHTPPHCSSLTAPPMERNAFASLFSQPQAASKKKQGFSSTRSKHVKSSAKRPRSSP